MSITKPEEVTTFDLFEHTNCEECVQYLFENSNIEKNLLGIAKEFNYSPNDTVVSIHFNKGVNTCIRKQTRKVFPNTKGVELPLGYEKQCFNYFVNNNLQMILERI